MDWTTDYLAQFVAEETKVRGQKTVRDIPKATQLISGRTWTDLLAPSPPCLILEKPNTYFHVLGFRYWSAFKSPVAFSPEMTSYQEPNQPVAKQGYGEVLFKMKVPSIIKRLIHIEFDSLHINVTNGLIILIPI